MKSSIPKMACIAAMLVLMLGAASNAWATGYKGGVSWQVGDVIICFGSGTCNVVRIIPPVFPSTTPTVVLLDQFSDTQPGDTRGVAINNTLHAVVTDNAGSSGSNVVTYTIASVVPSLTLSGSATSIAHTPVSTPFNSSGGTNSGNAQAVVVNGAGHIFVGNAGSGSPVPSIVELNPDGTPASASPTGSLFTNPLPLTGCADISGQLLSMDLSKNGLFMYLTTSNTSYQTSTSNGGHVQKITLSTGACTPFASFGPGVALNGIQDVPAGALANLAKCQGASPTDTGGSGCPSGESVLVVAEGFFDGDGDPAGEPPIPDQADDTNICTNALNSALVSCALLLDTGGPGLTGSPWVAGGSYTTDDTVLDANLHVQKVTSANGTSGGGTPAWSTNGGTTPDGTLTWTDQGTSVVARYPVVGKDKLQALALDQLVRDCSTGSTPILSGTCATTLPTVSNFWLGDNSSSNFYELDFATGAGGTPTAISANANAFGTGGVCLTCSSADGGIQGLRIYGGEGSTQAGLTKLASGTLQSTNSFTQIVRFPLPVVVADTNSMTVTLSNVTNPDTDTFPFSLYGSLVSKAAFPPSGNNSGASDQGIRCEPTTSDPAKCIVWKVDIPTGSAMPLPATSYVATNFKAPTGIDPGTDVFLDEHYDVTTFVGSFDPGGGGRISVWSLQEVPSAFFSGTGTGSSGCFYVSPAPAGACFKNNRTTLPFEFQCPGVPPSQFMNMKNGPPQLSLVKSTPAASGQPKTAPLPIQLTTTNNKAPYRFNGTDYIFNWSLNGTTGTFDACTFDPTGTVQTFCTNFTVGTGPKCK